MVFSSAGAGYIDRRAEKHVLQALEELSKILDPGRDIEERAREIAYKAIEKGVQRGRSYRCVALASIYAASRLLGKPLPIKHISAATGTPLKELRSCYNSLLISLGRELKYQEPPDPRGYMVYVSRRLGIGEAVAEEAMRILDSIKEKISFVGKDPTGYVAAAIYIASRKLRRRISKSRLAAEIGVTEVTIRARIREVAEKLGIDVDGRKRRASRRKNIS